MPLKEIKKYIQEGNFDYSDHALKRMIERQIDSDDVEYVIMNGEIIENYPGDKYSPSCLIYGQSIQGRDLHVQVSFPPIVVIITTYEPGPEEWINGKIRKK